MANVKKVILSQRTSATTVSEVANQRSIGNLISHIGGSDPHLFNALNSLQSQNNHIVQNIVDIIKAVNDLCTSVQQAIQDTTGKTANITPPAVPGGGGIVGRGNTVPGISTGNTRPIPKPVSRLA
jgi:hypothetical protein